jgi:menaquinone-specific isochorismate synthase
MRQFSINDFGTPDKEGLEKFLGACQSVARKSDHPVLATISLPSEFLDPLAVLQSVNDPSRPHFYMERNAHHVGMAGAEPVLVLKAEGVNRFASIKSQAQMWLEHTCFVGDGELPWAGPQFFCQFSFEDELDDEAFLPPAFAFVPRWMVAWRGNKFSATANLVVEANSDLNLLIEPLMRAHQRFQSFEYDLNEDEMGPQNDIGNSRIIGQSRSEELFVNNVKEALSEISSGQYEKIVVSRSLELESDQPFKPLEVLDMLRQRFPDCTTSSYQNGKGASFISATPERLIEVRNGKFYTEALAGSMQRGRGALQDAHLTKQLLGSSKNRNEHGVVLKFISEQLKVLGLKPEFAASPEVLQLSNIQHLRVPVSGQINGEHILDLAAALHPTPALGGFPREEALEGIKQLEPSQRGPYAGVSGWFDFKGEGELVVNIRCALVEGHSARLYAGCGIVEGSDPEKELKETELKLISMLPCFIDLDQIN